MGFNIKNNYGPNIDVHDGGVVNLRQHKDGTWQTDDEQEIQEAEIEKEVTDIAPTSAPEAQLNYFAPTKNLQILLKQSWFKELRTKDEYDEAWTDGFVEALMQSEFRDGIALEWATAHKPLQIKGHIIGLLKDMGVLKGSYDKIAEEANLIENTRTFSKYMGKGKKQPYAEWVKDYVNGIAEQ